MAGNGYLHRRTAGGVPSIDVRGAFFDHFPIDLLASLGSLGMK